MKTKLILLLWLLAGAVYCQNTPVTTLTNVDDGVIGQSINVPVTVTTFNDIAVVSLTIVFNPNALAFIGGDVPNNKYTLSFGNSIAGEIRVVGEIGGVTLPDGSVLFNLNFKYLGGFSELRWFDGGDGCMYARADLIPLIDVPYANYYKNGMVFTTVTINEQTWMKQNLNIGKQITASQLQTNNGFVEKYCYKDSVENCNVYGGLYGWGEVMAYAQNGETQGICPDGWHVPTNADWRTLVNGIGDSTNAGEKLKETGWVHWQYPRAWTNPRYSAIQRATFEIQSGFLGLDTYGFSALGSGYTYANSYVQKKQYGYFWSSTKNPNGNIYIVAMTSTGKPAYIYEKYSTGYSVPKVPIRCVKN